MSRGYHFLLVGRCQAIPIIEYGRVVVNRFIMALACNIQKEGKCCFVAGEFGLTSPESYAFGLPEYGPAVAVEGQNKQIRLNQSSRNRNFL